MRSYFLEKIFKKNRCLAGLLNCYFLTHFSKKTIRLDYFICIFGISIKYNQKILYKYIINSTILKQHK
ncbi:hypothetical protein FLBR109950_04105 [Flavobacterium branchiophilum]